DRTDAGAPAAERSWLPGHRRQHAGFNNCVEGVALTMFAVVYARTRLGGAEQTEPMQGRRRPSAAGYRVIADSTPVSTTALRGIALTMFAVVYARTRLRGGEQTDPMQGRRRPSAAGYRVIADSTPVSTTALRGLALTMFAVVYARTRLGGAEQTEPMQGRRRPSAA